MRLSGFDYSQPGEYFVTICTKDRVCWFGEIKGGKVRLSPIGMVVEEEWRKTEDVRTNVELDAFVVMPNHIHGIIVLKSLAETTGPVVSHATEMTNASETTNATETTNALETTQRVVSTRNKTLMPNSLGSIVGQFKSVVTKRIHADGHHDFAWQPGYYDHVVRNEKDLERIREYIRLNPERWTSGDEFAENIKMDPIHTG